MSPLPLDLTSPPLSADGRPGSRDWPREFSRGRSEARGPPEGTAREAIANPLYHGAKYPKSSPPANFCPSHSGGYLGRVNAAENHQDLSRRSRKMARRQASPSWLAPPSVDRAIASRAVPSGRPRASDGHANSRGANPGIRVSHPPTMGGEFKPNGSGEEALKNPSGAAAREGFARDRELSAHLRRSRSHEPRARYPTAFRRRVGMR